MSRQEFLYEHDVVGIATMLNQLRDDQDDSEQIEEVPGVDFL